MEKGFMLAEVLLTLAIIGVVAALTIPAVIVKVQQDQYVVGLKKAYNTLKAVEREAIQEHGDIASWSWSNDFSDFEKYFKPHFDILKDCGTGTDDGCFVGTYILLNGSTNAWSTSLNNDSTHYKIITSDGISFAYRIINTNKLKAYIYVDVNGKKGPNIHGRDNFAFDVFSTIGIKPHGSYDNNGNLINSSLVENRCSLSSDGSYCAVKVLSEGAMNY